ncbi:MAG: C-GCAxxG-C-C family protein [Ruminococcus sp.]
MAKCDTARDLFLKGYNCSQAVFGAFCEDYGISRDLGLKLSSGFGGGFARRREVCGAVSGAVMVLSLEHGYSDLDDNNVKAQLYKEVRGVIDLFEEETGSIICRELLNLQEKTSSPVPEERTEAYYKKRPCDELVYLSAKLLEEHIAKLRG